MSETSDLSKILLSFPSLLAATAPDGARRSWIQLAKTGSFVSTRYGKFSITRDDLSTMLHNYNTITPKDPTELPIDYDHLSMDPKKPGDGIAAGWMKKLELRAEGDELWCEVEWTPDGAERIANNEYRFVSPSFVKNHVHKDGKKIGTTLLAAAITNHPFLDGMSALTLYNFAAIGDLALAASSGGIMETGGTMKIGQRVMIAPGQARTQDEIGGTFEITEVVGDGANAFVTVKDANGVPHKWFRATELLPASATPANPIQPNLEPAPGTPTPGAPKANKPGGVPAAKAHPMPPDRPQTKTTDIEQQAAQFSARVAQKFALVRDWTKAFTLAQDEDVSGAEAYRCVGIGVNRSEPEAAPEARPGVISLHRQADETFLQLVTRVRHERALPDWKAAYRLCADAFPALAEEYGQGTAL